MLPICIKVELQPPPDVSARKLKEIMREAHRQQAESWHRRYARLHFEPIGRYRYAYQRRSPGYRKQKARLASVGKVEGGGEIDLVHSGLTRRKAMARPLIKALPTRATVQMATPSYVTMHRRRADRPDLAAEILKVVRPEQSRLGQEMQTKVEKDLAAIKEKKTITIR